MSVQELIDDQPNILPICDFCPGVGNLFSLGREMPVCTGAAQGYIDNMLVTDDGRLVLVETKLWKNPEALREVVAQTLQYGMAISELSSLELERQLGKASPKGRRLGPDESVTQYVRKLTKAESLDDDFEDRFETLRSAREILLLVVGDGIHKGVERLIQWINNSFGSSPCKFGLIELKFYNLPDAGRVVVPRTLLRTREIFRHVVSVNVKSSAKDQVEVSVRGGPDGSITETKTKPPKEVLTEKGLTYLMRAKNSPQDAKIAEQLLLRLSSSGLATKYCPSEILYGVEIEGDFISLVHVCATFVYFLIPMRAVHVLDEQLAECKRKLNKVADFYHPSDVEDGSKNQSKFFKYKGFENKIEEFGNAVAEISESIRTAMTVAQG